jgi:hypothetical protein
MNTHSYVVASSASEGRHRNDVRNARQAIDGTKGIHAMMPKAVFVK